MTAVGDSITVGYLSTNPWPANIGASIGKTAVNQGVDGIGFNHNPSGTLNGTPSIISEGAGTTDPTRTSNACGSTPPVLIVLAGTNDIGYGSTGAATYGFFQTWISARLADGWPAGDIVVGTILQMDGGTPERAAFNTLLVSGQATYGYKLARLDLDPNIGCNACNTNPAFFNTDGTHPNNTGQQIIANIMCNAMGTGLPCPAYPSVGCTNYYVGVGDISPAAAWAAPRAYSSATCGQRFANVCVQVSSMDTCADMFTDSVGGSVVPLSIGGTMCPEATGLCTWKIAYDQTLGNNCSGSCDWVQATVANRFKFLTAASGKCLGALVCLDGAQAQMVAAGSITLPQPFSLGIYGYFADFDSAGQYLIYAGNAEILNPGIDPYHYFYSCNSTSGNGAVDLGPTAQPYDLTLLCPVGTTMSLSIYSPTNGSSVTYAIGTQTGSFYVGSIDDDEKTILEWGAWNNDQTANLNVLGDNRYAYWIAQPQRASIAWFTTYQTMDEFGGSTWVWADNLTSTQMDPFFSPTVGIGYNYVRTASTFDGSIPDLVTLQAAVARGVKVWMSFSRRQPR